MVSCGNCGRITFSLSHLSEESTVRSFILRLRVLLLLLVICQRGPHSFIRRTELVSLHEIVLRLLEQSEFEASDSATVEAFDVLFLFFEDSAATGDRAGVVLDLDVTHRGVTHARRENSVGLLALDSAVFVGEKLRNGIVEGSGLGETLFLEEAGRLVFDLFAFLDFLFVGELPNLLLL